ncbi:nuclear transport factor 2 family protein [Saccharothrix sp. AJ9571]|nr:nuclear transport factor 2 family protein [Saccharothrix sp. AJ9571]
MTPSTFAARYTAVWNEPDAALRRKAITELWAEDGAEYLPSTEYHGHDALEVRVAAAYEQFVAPGECAFVPAEDSTHNHDAITFSTHLVPVAGGVPVWTGTVFAQLDDEGRIRRDYQFARPDGSTRAVVTGFLDRLATGDPDLVAGLFAEQVDWQLDWPAEGHAAVPWIRARSTRADVADHFRQLNEFHVPEKQGGGAPKILVDGTDAVVLGDIRQTVRATGRAYVARCALHVTVEEGLITRYHVYEDSLTVARAHGG